MSYFLQREVNEAPRGRGRAFCPPENLSLLHHESNPIPQPRQAHQRARQEQAQFQHQQQQQQHSSAPVQHHSYPEDVQPVPAHHLPPPMQQQQQQQQPQRAPDHTQDSWLGRLSAGGEVPAADLQRKHPNITKHSQSTVFAGPKADPQPLSRVHYHSEEALRSLLPQEVDRKEQAANAMIYSAGDHQGGPVAKMLGNDVPWRANAPPVQERGPHRSENRNKSLIGIGGFQSLPPSTEQLHSGRKRGVEDYDTYVQDPLAPRRFVKIDGKTVDTAMLVAPPVVCPVTGSHLVCNDYVMNGAGANPYGNRPAVQRQQIAEPPHRKPLFEHGRPVLS